MYQSKLIKLLQTLSTKELKKFEEYVNSPFFNKSKQSCQLLNILLPYAPDYTNEVIEKHHLFKALFPNKNIYKRSNLTVAMTKLTKLLEDFLVYLRSQKKPLQNHYLLLESLLARDQNYFEQLSKKTETLIDSIKHKDIHTYYQQYRISEILYRHSLMNKNFKEAVDLSDLLKDLDIHFIIAKLKYCCAALNRENIFNTQHNILFLEDILKVVETTDYLKQIPLIHIYYTALMMIKEETEQQHFEQLKVLLQLYGGQLSETDSGTIHALATNYCRKKILAGDEHYYAESLQIYEYLLDNNLFMDMNGFIRHQNFKNIVTLGLKARKYIWTKQFIDHYQEKIHPDIRQSVYHFSMGAWHLYKNEFTQALQHLLQVVYIDINYHLDSKKLLLCSYYELNETEALLALVDTFKKLLYRNKEITPSTKTSYLNFIKLLVKLYKVKALRSNDSIIHLKQTIENTALLSDKQWLMNAVDALSR